MGKRLRRAASILLAFAIIITMGMPVQAQTENDILAPSIHMEETLLEESESTAPDEETSEQEPTIRKGAPTEDEAETPSEVPKAPTEDPEKPETEPSHKDMPESTNENNTEDKTDPQEECVSENTIHSEEETVSENTLPPCAAGDTLAFNADSKYVMVAQSSGLAINATASGWANHIKVSAAYYKDSNKIVDEKAQFIITPADDADIADENITTGDGEVKVRIESLIEGDNYPFRVETPNNYAFADADKRYDQKQEIYLIKKTEEHQGTLRAASNNRYATIDNGELRFDANTTEEQAEKFLFFENPGILNTAIRIEHKASGKYIKTYQENGTPLTVDGNADEEGVTFSKAVFDSNSVDTVDGQTFVTISLVSEDYANGVGSVFWSEGQKAEKVKSDGRVDGNGWETIRILGNGDGTISFKDSCFDQYITVKDGNLMCGEFPRQTAKEDLTDQEKFILHTEITPLPASNLHFDAAKRTQSTVDLLWENPRSLFTGIEIWQKKASEDDETYQKVGEAGSEETYTATDLEKDTEYSFKIRPVLVNGNGADSEELYGEYSEAVTVRTRVLEKPQTPENIQIEERDGKVILSWDAVENVTDYRIYEASGMFSEFTPAGEDIPASLDMTAAANAATDMIDNVDEIATDEAAADIPAMIDTALPVTMSKTGRVEAELDAGENKYDYYRITAVRKDEEGTEESDQSDAVSLETLLFGDHTIFLSPEDDVQEVDKLLKELFDKQNDYNADAQFNGEQWQVYFKPGDYTETACMYLGFYTSFNGLGKTPYDVKLNNIAIPAYLPGGSLGGGDNNATCNFWRSAENLSVIATGNAQGKAKYGADTMGRGDTFNWAVAQAAPLRRVYSERPVNYDWNWGWASGGYVADCLITGMDDAGNGAGTWSGQQFFTRNSEIKGNTFGTTLNNFFMGVQAANNLTGETGKPLRNGNGYTNWGIKGAISNDDQVGGQQVVTEITNTPKISEKPFLYLDDGEYKVFVPAVRENTRGVSWGEGKANDGMGEGTSLSLSMFYIAKPTDTAAEINRQIADGKHIYFTPGIYHAETPIVVNRENTILLGTGMASIIPDNGEMALRVEDKDGIRIEGLIFDAGASSKLLLQVGTKGTHTNHSDNPIILQDLFFRVGGTTDVLTKADDAMEINSDDVIGDHFWIWRADHGAGVEWYGNESKHGLIVNGDRVKCYALFNEHFQEYHTLWNGEDGETYFYQNETCYDPISQEAWMSHNGTVKGYSSYKVNNDVERHYAAGLGVYNVFIYTGKTYDGKGIGIQLDNAIEVPNKPGVMVENACTQTFANDEKEGGGFYPLSSINHIINGIGGIVSSGMSEDLVRGEGWSRKFVLYYHDGEAEYGKEPDRSTFVYGNSEEDKQRKPYDQRGKFIGTEIVTVEPPADEEIFLDRISKLYNQFSDKTEDDYTVNSWNRADMENVLKNTKSAIDKGKLVQAEMAAGKKYSQSEISALQTQINKACTTLESASEKLVYIGDAVWQRNKYRDYKKNNYTQDGWNTFDQARTNLNQVLDKANQADPITTKDVYLLQTEIDAAYEALEDAASKLTPISAISVTGVALNRESLSIRRGNTFRLMAITSPADATNQKVKWDSSDEKTVSVDQSGNLTALVQGTAEITVTTEDGGYTAVCAVSVIVEEDDKADPLKNLIAECEALIRADYTTDSWKPFANALSNAKEVAARQDAAQEELDNAFKTLIETRDALELRPDDSEAPVDKDQLRELISQCESLNRNDYTRESWEVFAKVLADAQETAADVNVTQDDVEAAIENLSQALEQLMDREGLWAFDIADITYTGKAIKPTVTVYNGKTLLTQGKDYTVSYKNNTKVTESAQAVIKGKGNYGGSLTKTFAIVPLDLSAEDILIPDLYVKAPKAGKSVAPAPVVTRNGKKLSKNAYTIGTIKDKDGNSIDKITAPGIYTVEVSGVLKNGYTGVKEIHMTVAESDQILMSAVKVTGIQNKAYTGDIVEPEFTVKYGKDTLTLNVDYQVSCSSREIGTAKAVITGTGTKYIGEKTITFKITGTTLKAKDVKLDTTEALYTGNAIEPNVTIENAELNRDYTVEYDKNINVGNAVVTVKGIGKLTGTVKKNFKITAFDIKQNEGGSLSYNTEALTAPFAKGGSILTASDINISFNGNKLTEGIDYTLAYASNKKVGTASVKIRGKGNFKGVTDPVLFTVLQQDLSKLTDVSAADVLEKNAPKYNRVIPTVKDLDGKALKKGTDFVVTGYTKTDGTTFEKTPTVGDTIRVTMKGVDESNYKGTAYADFRVIENNNNISKASVKINAQSYTGKAIELSEFDPVSGEQRIFVTMKVNGKTRTLKEGTDYEIVKSGYSKNINKGTGRLVIRGINEYGGTKTVSFKITPYTLTTIEWYNDLYSRALSLFAK